MPTVSQAAVSKWEDGSQRPELSRALQLEGLTGGDVSAVSWLYDTTEINALRRAFGFPNLDPNDVADAVTIDRGPEYAQPAPVLP